MVRQQKHYNGFTLIELMLATSLLMMVLFSGYYAYSLYTQKWQKRVDTFWQGTQNAIGIDSLNRMLAASVPYIVKNSDDKAHIYFRANEEELEWVTASPIFSQGIALVNVKVIQHGTFKKLQYSEKSMENFVLINSQQSSSVDPEFWEYKTVLVDEIEQVSFNFYGWQSFNDALGFVNEDMANDLQRDQPKKAWYAVHQSNTQRILPEQVHVTLALLQNQHEFSVQLPEATVYTLMSHIRKDID